MAPSYLPPETQKFWALHSTTKLIQRTLIKSVKSLKKRNNVLKKLDGNTWFYSKETSTNFYKAIGRSVLNYASPIWTPTLSYTNWQNLQVKQNNATGTIIGCVKMSDITHLLDETKVLLFRKHYEMLSKQFLLGCYQDHRADLHTLSYKGYNRNSRSTLGHQLTLNP